MKIEDTLNGGYAGLYAEVVTHDCYRLKTLPFIPEVVFDFGGNIGIFSRFARTLFPDALIIAVEPHPENRERFKEFTHDDKIILIEKAIGRGKMWHNLGARNGSGESYVSSGLGYDKDMMDSAAKNKQGIEASAISSVMPDEIIWQYWKPGMKAILKCDCEGCENRIFSDKASMDMIRQMDYIAMEVHFYALMGGVPYQEVQEQTRAALKELEETHTCELDNVHFWAIKKEYANTI
jgi:FkbM family methyltransferase